MMDRWTRTAAAAARSKQLSAPITSTSRHRRAQSPPRSICSMPLPPPVASTSRRRRAQPPAMADPLDAAAAAASRLSSSCKLQLGAKRLEARLLGAYELGFAALVFAPVGPGRPRVTI